MKINFNRTFSIYRESSEITPEDDWTIDFELNRGHGQKIWSDLHESPLSIVLGEAGIGKTTEFQLEAERLIKQGKSAFFLPLNQLTDIDSWSLAIQESDFNKWKDSNQLGYFLLDAVDEARLRSHADFEKALSVIRHALKPYLANVRIAISSRLTDWSEQAVRSAVEHQITSPLKDSRSMKEDIQVSDTEDDATTIRSTTATTQAIEPLVVTLDPLSMHEANRCAAAFDLQESEQFWTTVSEASYEFMARRPLDLKWMISLWNTRRTLGTYSELMDANIDQRLQEINENYKTAEKVLSVDQLRKGAMKLAAAAEFGNCTYFVLEVNSIPRNGELNPYAVLADWEQPKIQLLLATAIFDEASYALRHLKQTSTQEHRQQIVNDLNGGLLTTNELIAGALTVIDWQALTAAQLTSIFDAAKSEANYGTGPIVHLFKNDLLPQTNLASAIRLLEAVMATLPRPTQDKRFARFAESDKPEKVWMLDVLPETFERVLDLLPSASDTYPTVCMEAAERIEAQRYSGFTDRVEFIRLHNAIARYPNLRLDIALALAQSEDIQASVSRLTSGMNCLVTMTETDLPELTFLSIGGLSSE